MINEAKNATKTNFLNIMTIVCLLAQAYLFLFKR